MRPFRICKHVEDQDGRTNRQIQEQKRVLKKLPWKRKSLVLAVFVLLRGRFRERFRRNGKRDLGVLNIFFNILPHFGSTTFSVECNIGSFVILSICRKMLCLLEYIDPDQAAVFVLANFFFICIFFIFCDYIDLS